MADPTLYPDATDDTGIGPAANRPPATPRWVKVFGIIALGLVLLLAIGVVTGRAGPGGGHGPGRHTPGGGGATPASTVPAGHTPPAGGQ